MVYKLSLSAAVAINLNIMLSAGIFLNSIPLAKYAGGFCFVPYLIIGTLLIPLIIAMASLLRHHEDGTFYQLGKQELGSFWGFLSSWTYFIAKPASAALMIHFFNDLMMQLFPFLQKVSIYTWDLIVILIFAILNLLNMKIGRSIQFSFIFIKLIPLLFIIIAGLWFLQPINFSSLHLNLEGISLGLPLALFACSGFEATLSLASHIENSKRNASRAIIISYLIAIVVYILYQLGYYAAINIDKLAEIASFNGIAFFLKSMFAQPHYHLQALLYICIGISSLGGAYGILFSNNWNLHTLAEHHHTFCSTNLIKKNCAGIAYWCLFIEILICFSYIYFTNANQIMLQQMSAFGSTIAYTISISAFVILAFKKIKKNWAYIVALLALLNCFIFLASCINGFLNDGAQALYAFTAFLIFGSVMYTTTRALFKK
jgi:amino acid transporter